MPWSPDGSLASRSSHRKPRCGRACTSQIYNQPKCRVKTVQRQTFTVPSSLPVTAFTLSNCKQETAFLCPARTCSVRHLRAPTCVQVQLLSVATQNKNFSPAKGVRHRPRARTSNDKVETVTHGPVSAEQTEVCKDDLLRTQSLPLGVSAKYAGIVRLSCPKS